MKMKIQIRRRINSNKVYFYLTYLDFESKVLCKVSRSFTITILRKIEVAIDFNGSIGHFFDVNTY